MTAFDFADVITGSIMDQDAARTRTIADAIRLPD
jgi:hypothetical protein